MGERERANWDLLLQQKLPSSIRGRDRSICRRLVREMANPAIESLVESIKSKVRALKKKTKSGTSKSYVKMMKSSSVKVEIRSRKARKLIDKTLKAADHPGKRSIS
ncbi:hypothetical protein SAY87_001309 [Trapa incisa]|nr:hypothetical protein SAY87_001309 [Trapa incisa]